MKVIGQNLWRIGLLLLGLVAAAEVLPAQNLPADGSSTVMVVGSGWAEYLPESGFSRRVSFDGYLRPTVWRNAPPDCYSQGLSYPCLATREREKQFVYQVKIRNAGEKQIVALDWEYIFIDPETEKIIARHAFHSQTRIQPHKSKTLSEISASPPTDVIDIRMLYKNPAGQFIERIVVNSVIFLDGSVWRRSAQITQTKLEREK